MPHPDALLDHIICISLELDFQFDLFRLILRSNLIHPLGIQLRDFQWVR